MTILSQPNFSLTNAPRPTASLRGAVIQLLVPMSVQIFLQGKILGGEQFLLSTSSEEISVDARAHWIALLTEVLPRALLAELGLSKMLLGSSGGEQFLLV